MNIASLCARDVVGILADASLHEAATRMCEEHVGALVVVTADEPPKVVGIVTDRDLALDVLGRAAPSAELRTGDVAKFPTVAVQGSASLQEAVAAMEKAAVRRLLVVDDDGGVIGLVSPTTWCARWPRNCRGSPAPSGGTSRARSPSARCFPPLAGRAPSSPASA